MRAPRIQVMAAIPPSSTEDQALLRFLDAWQRDLTRLQRAHPARFRVHGLSEGEVKDALLLALLEASRAEPRLLDEHAAAFQHVKAELSALRRRFRLRLTPVDLRELTFVERLPTQEERLSELQCEQRRERAAVRAEASLSRPQRRWLAALKLAARAGAFFAASDQLNLARAARVRGVHRSSAQRAYVSLCAHFSRELECDE